MPLRHLLVLLALSHASALHVSAPSLAARRAPSRVSSFRLQESSEGEGAIARNRELMGATNPQEADAGTIRADFAQSIDANAVHGSDSSASAEREIAYFFASSEICPR